jgi:sugar lactone lactonase YvrE
MREHIFIADASPIRQTPALVLYDTNARTSRRVLVGHPSVQPENYMLRVGGRDMRIFGLVTMRIGIDSIALDRRAEWLYYGPVNGGRLYRVNAIEAPDVADWQVANLVEDYGPKPLSDGLTTDVEGNVYITDPEHSAILVLDKDRHLRTLVKDERLRWPDGLSFGPEGWLYVTCSALQDVLLRTSAHMRAHAPYQIYRSKPGPEGRPGS